MRELKEVFRRHRSQPIGRVIYLINPMLRGWVNYFAVGHSSECFSFVKDWVEKKVMRQLAHANKQKGFGWERWNRRWQAKAGAPVLDPTCGCERQQWLSCRNRLKPLPAWPVCAPLLPFQ